MQTAPGQFVSPLAVPGAVQQYLNPGLPAYRTSSAGEAVRSQLSPDGKTLAILCAGQNSSLNRMGVTILLHRLNSFFLYDVNGNHKQSPVLTQVIPQKNSHVGMVFSPDGNTLYAAGGRDDVVYAYGKNITGWVLLGNIQLGIHGHRCWRQSQCEWSWDFFPMGRRLSLPTTTNDSISVIDTRRYRALRTRSAFRTFTNNELTQGALEGLSIAVVVKGNNVAYVSSDRDREVIAVDIIPRRQVS